MSLEFIKNTKPENRLLINLIIILIITFYLGRFFGAVGIILVLAPVALGLWLPKWYLKKAQPNLKLMNFIAWANVILWVLPPLGVFSGLMTLGLSRYLPTIKKKYLILGFLGLLLSIINAVWGILGD